MYETYVLIGTIIVLFILFLAEINLSNKINKNIEEIKDLKSDSSIFCSGTSMERVKMRDVIYRLLYVLGYEVREKEIVLVKRNKK